MQRPLRPKIGVLNAQYYVDMVRRYLPTAEIVVLESPAEYFESRGDELDPFLFAAEAGAAWTLLHPRFAVAIPRPDVVAVPVAWAAARDDVETARFLGTWFEFKRANGVLDRLYDRCVLGRDPVSQRPRSSVLRDVLGWRDASAAAGQEGGRSLGGGE